jgi:putative hydroxymethylpyrimidine transport system substrate-binding protein
MLPRLMRLTRILALLLGVAAVAAGCGSGAPSHRARDASLVLDFTPGAVHAGIYSAIARGLDRREGVRLHVVVPSASTDSIQLLETGRVNLAILDIHDLAIARERGENIVGVMAIVERPLAAVISAPDVSTPARLDRKTVGITGVPSDTAVLRSIVSGGGGSPRTIKTVTIGFDAVPALLARRVAGVTAFWNDEGVTLAHARPGFHIFRVDSYGAPPYPELVLCATGRTVRNDPGLVSGVVRALVAGYRFTLADPAASLADLRSRAPGLDRSLLAAKLRAVASAFAGPGGTPGTLDSRALARWARWEVRFGIVNRAPDPGTAFDPSFVDGAHRRG